MMTFATFLIAWVIPAATLPAAMPPELQGHPFTLYCELPYLIRVALLVPFALLASLPLILVSCPFPSREAHDMNVKIHQAREAARAALAKDSE